MKLTISRKLILTHFAMAFLAVLAVVYALDRFRTLNDLAFKIIHEDFYLVDISKTMIDTLLAQENAEKKYLVLKDPSFEKIFRQRGREFEDTLKALQQRPFAVKMADPARLKELQDRYQSLFQREKQLISEDRVEEAFTLSERESRVLIERMASILRSLQQSAEREMDFRMNMINRLGIAASRITLLLTALTLMIGVILALVTTINISRPLKKLEKATERIAEGNFDYRPDINRRDEIGSLAQAFGFMAERLKELEALHLDASPLTGLPGNLAIEKEIGRRLSEKRLFSLCHVDLDNFKPFADHYGYAWGSEVIKDVGLMLVSALDRRPDQNNGVFLGHIGGDDFVIIAEPGRAEEISREMIRVFDEQIMRFYSEKDRNKGYIIARDRQGIHRKYPLMTITIAIVTDDGSRFANPLDMAKKAAKLKEYAKTLPGSNYIREEDFEKEAGSGGESTLFFKYR